MTYMTETTKRTWWIWGSVQRRLTTWARALLHGRRYNVRLATGDGSWHDAKNKIIQVDPQMFPAEESDVQFRVTQGLLAHECGHAWFTGNWPAQEDNILRELVNMLEDERIERGICTLYPGIAPAIRVVGDLCYSNLDRPSLLMDQNQVIFGACLTWRWAHSRTSESDMAERIGMTDLKLWGRIRPLVERAWVAPDTDEVIRLAEGILRILAIPANKSATGKYRLKNSIPQRGGTPVALPKGPLEDAAPGIGEGLTDEQLPGIPATAKEVEPRSYIDLEQEVSAAANRLAEALKEPQPDQRPTAHEYRGRYNFRQEIRTPETPHLMHGEIGVAKRSLAMYVLTDCSGSMDRYDESIREAMMELYLAAIKVGIPLGMAYFGEDDLYHNDTPLSADEITVEQVVAEISPITAKNNEAVKALIAGYTGWANEEYLDWGLRKAESALRDRPERLRVVIIIHDGEPVYRMRGVSDWDLSLAHIRELEKAGIVVIGLHLGKDNPEKLRKLFPRLVECPNVNDLPDKLGRMLTSLA